MSVSVRNEKIDLKDFASGREKIVVEKLGTLPKKPVYSAVKRLFDFVVALVALILLLIPMLIISIVIVLDSPGKPIYSQIRLGKDQKPFRLYKFRSMKKDAEVDGAQWAEQDDPRVTRVGRVIRKTRIDELPQLLNILSGKMSLVGPRPERPEFYDLFDQYIDGFRQRTLVIPGLTGHAQVNGGYELLPEEKIVYDIEYIKNRSLKLDLQCILKTIRVVFTRDGAR